MTSFNESPLQQREAIQWTARVSQGISWHLLFGRYFFPFDAPSQSSFVYTSIFLTFRHKSLRKSENVVSIPLQSMLCLDVYTLISSGGMHQQHAE